MYTFYITQNGSIDRKGNTLYFIGEDFKRHLPVLNVSDIVITSKVSLSSWAIDYLSKLGIIVHILNPNGKLLSSLIPEGRFEKGAITVKQAIHYYEPSRRLKIAREILRGIRYNILRNIRYYNKNRVFDDILSAIREISPDGVNINEILGKEGKIWQLYYSCFQTMFNLERPFERSYRPPKDEVNSLISFGNTLLYATALSAIIIAGINPSISFLHEPSDRSFSLALDIADIFKPVIVERLIGYLLNNRIIRKNMFISRNGGVYLNDSGRRVFLEAYRNRIETTIKHGNRHLSYSSLMESEARGLLKHIVEGAEYHSFKSGD